jgi:positive regulator of sigma E activity
MASTHTFNRPGLKPVPFIVLLKAAAGFGLAALAMFAFLAPYLGLHDSFTGQIAAAVVGGAVGFILARR